MPKIWEVHELTLGLFDKNEKRQLISSSEAHEKIERTLLNHFGIYAFTMIDCNGCYRHAKSGEIVREPSIRIEIASDENIDKTVNDLIRALKHKRMFNQESIMYIKRREAVEFK